MVDGAAIRDDDISAEIQQNIALDVRRTLASTRSTNPTRTWRPGRQPHPTRRLIHSSPPTVRRRGLVHPRPTEPPAP
jgi:hypothetical protein